MSRFFSYLNSAVQIIESYQGGQPFAVHLKGFFAASKKYGSRDRKIIAHLCYCYFRIGRMCTDLPAAERILNALFLCSSDNDELLASIAPALNENITLPLSQKLDLLPSTCSLNDIFPFANEIGNDVDRKQFIQSHLVQPDLFIRVRPGYERAGRQKLENARLLFDFVSPNCVALPNATKAEAVLQLDREAVIQDYSSQRIREFFPITNEPIRVWDCCAASGGKSILLHDVNPAASLLVSDIRETIIHNLRSRFKTAGIQHYRSQVIDLALPAGLQMQEQFDLVMADVPCSGSGTWGRTPEHLAFFTSEQLEHYSKLQKVILTNIVPAIRPGGHLLYITCSVYEKENEEAVNFVIENFGLSILRKETLIGYNRKADTLFAALLRKA
jgi:16S rRNA (cytosine967-C5)-methyltransferase